MFLDRKPFLSWPNTTFQFTFSRLGCGRKFSTSVKKKGNSLNFNICNEIQIHFLITTTFYYSLKLILPMKRIDKERFFQFKSLGLSLPTSLTK